jgi:hypothetical protein
MIQERGRDRRGRERKGRETALLGDAADACWNLHLVKMII